MRIWPIVTLSLVAACGSSKSPAAPDAAEEIDAAPDASTGFNEAPHDNPPQVIKLPGPVVATPKIVPIFFQNDATMQGQVEPYLHALVSSDYWSKTTSEYGVGNLTILPTIVSSDTPPTTDDALKTWIAGNLDGTHGWPAPDDNTIYTVFLPDGVSLSTPFGSSCSSFGGYHDEGVVSATAARFIYALMPRCDTSIDSMSIVTSHELVEASTDPFPFTAGAYQQTDDPHIIWSFTPGGELGDMCEYVAAASQQLVGQYYVQRTWSNLSAAQGHDPCVPVMPGPYLGAAPVLSDATSVDLMDGTGPHATNGIQIAAGSSKTIEVDLFSDADAPDWTVKASDASALTGGGGELSFTWDKTTGHNGDKLHLTITHSKAGQSGGSEFVISSRTNNHSVSLWWGYVAN
jgi:hypothetical protein